MICGYLPKITTRQQRHSWFVAGTDVDHQMLIFCHNLLMFFTRRMFSSLISSQAKGSVARMRAAASRYSLIQLHTRPWRANASASPRCRKKVELVNGASQLSVYRPVKSAATFMISLEMAADAPPISYLAKAADEF